jgi:hypothetical protein
MLGPEPTRRGASSLPENNPARTHKDRGHADPRLAFVYLWWHLVKEIHISVLRVEPPLGSWIRRNVI